MKSLPSARYHLILLGIAVLFAIGSATFLLIQSHNFESSFQHPSLGGKAGVYSPSSSTDAATVSEHLKNRTLWEEREDGASPYVSRHYLLKEGRLIDPMEGNEPLYPPVPNQWLIDHRLDYTDMNILERDPSHKGFTVREEFEAATDPNDPKQFPPLRKKLSFDAGSIRKSTYLLEFMNVEENNGTKELQIHLNGNKNLVAIGDTIPGAPFLKVIDFQKKKKEINDTPFDVSEVILQNTVTGERHTLTKKNSSREYKKGGTPIELIESVTFCYQLTGAAPEIITVERGREFPLSSLDKSYSETYKLVDISKDGVILDRQGERFTIRPSGQSVPIAQPVLPSSTP